MDRLQVIKNTREIAANALLNVLKVVLTNTLQVSELQFKNLWLGEIRKHKEVFPDGWYIPPPNGIGVIFANEQNLHRANWPSLRPKEFWPRPDVYLNKITDLVYLYAGPVDRMTGMVGDFGLTLYLGKNPKIIEHMKNSLITVKDLFNQVSGGMLLRDVFALAHDLLMSKGLSSNLLSLSDPTGNNIGHTIPFTDSDITPEERLLIRDLHPESNWNNLSNLLSKKRKFINSVESLPIQRGLAITLEPRPQGATDISLPMVYFHTIALFHEDGNKELLTGFDEIFRFTGMNFMTT